MDSRDIDKFLDTRLVFKYHGNSGIIEHSNKVNYSFQSAIHIGEGDFEFSYFVPEKIAESRDMAIIIAQTNARKRGNLYFVTNNITNSNSLESLRLILEDAKSSVLDNIYVENGALYFSMRFSSIEMSKFSNVLLKFTKNFEAVEVAYLGPNPGLDSTLIENKPNTGLTRAIWEYDMPKDSFVSAPINALGDEWVSDIRYMTKNDVVPQIFKTKEAIEDPENSGFNVISEKDHIYELTFSNRGSMIREYHNRSYERKIVRFERHLNYKNEMMRVDTVIPSVQIKDLLQVLSLVNAKYPAFNLKLVSISEI
jgi:hypothetical protein